ncbi:hypothetical protein AB0952_09035 [Streptomyces caniferus]|uniref:hypothetical protein n=1 Tax=Streptomyces caniferus TaxID=285557 RepID=UPI0034530A1B
MTQEKPRDTPAVLYVCAPRGETSAVGVERATDEGRAFAERYALRIVDEITDTYGEPVPAHRRGWARVREMAEASEIEVAIVRWPNALSPIPAHRPAELAYLKRHGVQILYSWPPLRVSADGGAGR